MLNNEKGFILPVTIIISFLFFLIFTFQVNIYLTEKGFYKETEELMVLENLMQLGVGDVQLELGGLNELRNPISNEFQYPNGTVSYNAVTLSETTLEVMIICSTKNSRRYRAQFEYDGVEKKITKWNEYH
ncbi:competence type IV pilus minor pilin ComGG [Ferdinandcohnia quinoae]|uniref:ComGG family competence protein n=1 Tax=Fredinandcohnia quinoae TaxID=2918902 RepID=A0AAW5E4A7_9BACI|nr:competence type IV pilus minor pilin ComGG [Fredinandcohnia sp. SECRCQ15]MCH1624912.1 ComGG family competence protein [Fredinandcohnia sp. SECRCQ15]